MAAIFFLRQVLGLQQVARVSAAHPGSGARDGDSPRVRCAYPGYVSESGTPRAVCSRHPTPTPETHLTVVPAKACPELAKGPGSRLSRHPTYPVIPAKA
ncbi:MAG TPA: hypothetical protein VGD42_06415, partial [Lysobacter sp.]